MKYYYKILQIAPTANSDEIKRAYRILALQYHPDKVQEPELKRLSEGLFKEILEAYEILSDPQKRHSYDAELQVETYLQQQELLKQQQDQLSKDAKQQEEQQHQFEVRQKINAYINATKDKINSNKRTPLHCEIIRCLSIDGDSAELYKICSLMIDAGVDVNAKDEFGKTALYYAVSGFNIDKEIIRLLLQRGALPNEQNLEGNSPLHSLLSRNLHHSYSDIFAEFGGNLNLPNNQGKTPFHHVIKFDCYIELLEALIKQGANLKLPYFNGKSLLFTAIQLRNLTLIAVLLKRGARMKIDDDSMENFNNIVKSFANNSELAQLVQRALQLSFPEIFNSAADKRLCEFGHLPPAKKQITTYHHQSASNPASVNGTLFVNENNQQTDRLSQTPSANLNVGWKDGFMFNRK